MSSINPTRIATNQTAQGILSGIYNNYDEVQKYSNELSSGYQVELPGDSSNGGTIQDTQNNLNQLTGYENQIAPAQSNLSNQENIIDQAINLVSQAQQYAEQGANQTEDQNERDTIAQQVWQIRDQLVDLANSQYQGQYVWSGTDTSTAPYAVTNPPTYTTGSTEAQQTYAYQGNTGTNSVQVGSGLSITTNTAGSSVWSQVIDDVQNIGRALEGYGDPSGSGADSGTTDTTLTATQQTEALSNLETQIETDSNNSLVAEQTSLGARQNRLTTAKSMIQSAQNSDQGVLNSTQNADSTTAATDFQQAEFALEASMQVNAKVLSMSILNYL